MALALLDGCGNDTPVAKFIVVDQKVVLNDWPDSAYVSNLDSILALEPVKKQKGNVANITMNSQAMPIFKLPPQVSGKKDAKDAGKKKAEGASAHKTTQAGPSYKENKSGGEAEAFASRFTDGLSRLQSDPENSALYRTVSASEGDDVMKLLRRTYGSGASSLPRFFVVGALKSVNPGVNLESLTAGDKVKLPRL